MWLLFHLLHRNLLTATVSSWVFSINADYVSVTDGESLLKEVQEMLLKMKEGKRSNLVVCSTPDFG